MRKRLLFSLLLVIIAALLPIAPGRAVSSVPDLMPRSEHILSQASPSLSSLTLPGANDLGLCFVYHDLSIWHELAQESGASLNRWQLSWYDIEVTKGQFDFSAFDPRVDQDVATGLAVSAILMGTPDWAATQGTTLAPQIKAEVKTEPWTIKALGLASTSASPPANLDLPWDHADNYWGRFVYNTVSHFKDRIKIWELWNEEDWSFFWTGSAQDYYDLLKVGYQAAKAADPDCTVLFGGLFLFENPEFFQDVLDLARQDSQAAENGYYFDALPLHLYSRSSQPYDTVNWVRWRMSVKGIHKPIWINETGAPVWNDGVGPGSLYEWSVTREEQAAYLVQAYANALAAGVDKFFVFRLHDANLWEAYGIVKNDLSHRPAFDALQMISTTFRHPAWTTRHISGGNVIVTLYGTERGKVTIMWNERPVASRYAFPAVTDSALVLDQTGHAEVVYPQDSEYVVTLSGATATRLSDPGDYIVGGKPVIIVEQDTTPPEASVSQLPDLTAQSSFPVGWHGSDDESGILSYDVQVRDGLDGDWQNWLNWTSQASATFEGQDGHSYYFRVRARDNAGNTAAYPDQAQAWTTVQLPTPTPTATPTSTST
ncbi:MAG: fibronectin type III domain-containing protein, partial [Anaerolineae bacterium]|nr:fibronectin type III domain-containing protein [Anaerolineae bacterium]